MRISSPMQHIFQTQFLRVLLLAIVFVPLLGYSASDGEGRSPMLSWLGSKDKNMSDVATKIATLNEDNEIWGLDFSPDGKQLAATAVIGEKINIWDWRSERIVKTLIKPQEVGMATITVPVRYSPDGRWLAACHGGGPPRDGRAPSNSAIWDTQTWQMVHEVEDLIPGICQAVGFTSDGKAFLRAVGRGGPNGESIIVYRADTWQPLWGLDTFPFYANTLAVSPDGKFVALGGRLIVPQSMDEPPKPIQPQILLIDTIQRKVVRTINAFPPRYRLFHLAWHPDGIHLAAGTEFGESDAGDAVRVFDVRTGNQVAGEPTSNAEVVGLHYTPNGKYLIESAIDKTIRIWDGQHQHLLQTIKGEAASLAVSSDSRYVAMGGDRKILIWELK